MELSLSIFSLNTKLNIISERLYVKYKKRRENVEIIYIYFIYLNFKYK